MLTTAGSDAKVQACIHDFGADAAFNYKDQEDFHWSKQVKEYVGKGGVDVVLDMVGGDYLQHNINVLSTKGRLRLIGFMNSPISTSVNMTRLLLKQITISGSVLRSQSVEMKRAVTTEIIQDVMPLFSNGQVRPFVFHTYDGSSSADDLELSANLAHEMMESSQHIGKIALQLSSIHEDDMYEVCNKSKK